VKIEQEILHGEGTGDYILKSTNWYGRIGYVGFRRIFISTSE
jgi:hypothetical protein